MELLLLLISIALYGLVALIVVAPVVWGIRRMARTQPSHLNTLVVACAWALVTGYAAILYRVWMDAERLGLSPSEWRWPPYVALLAIGLVVIAVVATWQLWTPVLKPSVASVTDGPVKQPTTMVRGWMGVLVPAAPDADSQPVSGSRPRNKPRPPFLTSAFGGSGTASPKRALASASRVVASHAEQGRVLVEAAWQTVDHSVIALAFGDPGIGYERVWPMDEDIKGRLISLDTPASAPVDASRKEEPSIPPHGGTAPEDPPRLDFIYSTFGDVEQAQADVLARAKERVEAASRHGLFLSEAVWQDKKNTRLGLAFGIPGRPYGRQWPNGSDIRRMLMSAVEEAPIPASVEPATSSSMPSTLVRAHAHDIEPAAVPTTKVCPDCAETVLAAARICRFCRYEFAVDMAPSFA